MLQASEIRAIWKTKLTQQLEIYGWREIANRNQTWIASNPLVLASTSSDVVHPELKLPSAKQTKEIESNPYLQIIFLLKMVIFNIHVTVYQ